VTDLWTDRLSEYLDGDLQGAERGALETHLADCATCRRTLEELRAVARRAAALERRGPEEDLWPGIAARITAPAPARAAAAGERVWWRSPRWTFSLPQLAAAVVLVALISSAAMWLVLSVRPGTKAALAPAPGLSGAGSPATTAQPASFEVQRYDAAIAELEGALREHRPELDPATVHIIERNLLIIDQATEQARRALAADPANPYLNGHLAAQLKLKVDLLRQATALVATHS
jgi:anti-sigma factor RsiW